MTHDKFRYQPDGMRSVFYNGTAHSTLGTILIVEDFHLSRLWIIHSNTSRRSHPEETATVTNGMVDSRTWERSSTLSSKIISHLIGIHIQYCHVLRMAYQHISMRHRSKRTDIIGWNLRILNIEGFESILLRIHYLQSATQRTNHQAMMPIFCQSPDTLLRKSILRHLISLPLSVAITGHAAIEGTEVHRTVAHRYAAYHDV